MKRMFPQYCLTGCLTELNDGLSMAEGNGHATPGEVHEMKSSLLPTCTVLITAIVFSYSISHDHFTKT